MGDGVCHKTRFKPFGRNKKLVSKDSKRILNRDKFEGVLWTSHFYIEAFHSARLIGQTCCKIYFLIDIMVWIMIMKAMTMMLENGDGCKSHEVGCNMLIWILMIFSLSLYLEWFDHHDSAWSELSKMFGILPILNQTWVGMVVTLNTFNTLKHFEILKHLFLIFKIFFWQKSIRSWDLKFHNMAIPGHF